MNIIALWHLITGIIIAGISLPLIKRKIKMNSLYGFRIEAAFESEERWYNINAYGGRMFFKWGIAIIITGMIGIPLPQNLWIAHSVAAVIIILGGLAISICKTLRYADTLKKP